MDPFAGGSVRGVVAAVLGHPYFGVDIREEQLVANLQQWEEIKPLLGWDPPSPRWVEADATSLETAPADFAIACPPYGSLEVYSDDPRDLSNMVRPDFESAYKKTIQQVYGNLKDGAFAAYIVGDYRDKEGFYCNLPGATIAFAEQAGFHLYNEAVLLTMIGSLPIITSVNFPKSLKLGKGHQNVLIFWKGERKREAMRGTIDKIASKFRKGE